MIDENWKQVSNHIICKRPEYIFELDEHRNGDAQMIFVHVTVHKWSKSTLKEMLSVFRTFRECVTCPLYAVGEVDDDKWASFVSLFGFRPLLDQVVCINGERRRLFVHLKQEQKNERLEQIRHTTDAVERPEPLGCSGSVPDAGV
jgi:hypothetical protein